MKNKVFVFLAVVIFVFLSAFPVSAISANRTVQTGYKLPFPAGKSYNITKVGSNHGTGRHSIDFSMSSGTQVSAMASGVVRRVDNLKDIGNFISIDHGNYCSHYIHLSKFRTSVGNYVRMGEIIGLSGNTGNSTGPHLHVTLTSDVNNSCPYNTKSEYPIGFIEYSNNEILRLGRSKTSMNTLYVPPFSSSATINLRISKAEVNLTVCDPNNINRRYVYATLYRGPVSGYPAKSWSYVKLATSNCVTFTNMDGTGNTYAGVKYYIVTSLGPISSTETTAKRNSCFYETSRRQICGVVRR